MPNYNHNPSKIVWFSLLGLALVIFLGIYLWAFIFTGWENRPWERAVQDLSIGLNPYTENLARRQITISQAEGWVYGPLSLYLLYPIFLVLGRAFLVKTCVLLAGILHFLTALISTRTLHTKTLESKIVLAAAILANPLLLVLGSQGNLLDLGLVFFLSLSLYYYRKAKYTNWIITCCIGLLWKQVFLLLLPVLIIQSYNRKSLLKNFGPFLLMLGIFSLPFVFWDPVAYLYNFLGLASVFRELLVLPENWWNMFQLSLKVNISLKIVQFLSWGLILISWTVLWTANANPHFPMEYSIVMALGIFATFYYSSYTLYFGWIIPILFVILVEHFENAFHVNAWGLLANDK